MKTIDWIVRIILLLAYFAFMAVSIKHALHMFQQNRYEIYRYTAWLKKKLSQETTKLLGYAAGAAVLLIPIFFINNLWGAVLLAGLLCLFASVQLTNEKKKAYIKPLHFTPRVMRQTAVMAVLNLIWIIPVLFFLPPWVWVAAAPLSYIINWLLIYLMAFLTSPIEKAVKKHFMNLASAVLDTRPDLIKIGITGSYGKTSSKNIMQEILSEKFYSLMTPASFNTPMGITITIRTLLKPLHQVFICEMGADHVNDIDFLTKFVKPQVGVVTSIGPQHLNTFGSLENIIREKMKMIENLPQNGTGILNKDNEYIRNYKVQNSCDIIWYGIEQEEVDYRAVNIRYTPAGSSFDVITKDKESYSFTTRLLGEHNIANILASIAAARELDVPWIKLQEAVSLVKFVEHRLEIKKINGYTFIDDAFNSNPVGSAMSLEVLSMMPNQRLIVTPGMIDLGSKQEEINREFGRKMLGKADIVILVGETQTKPILRGLQDVSFAKENIYVVKTVKDAFSLVYQKATPEDTILLENDLPDAFNN